MRMKIGVRRLLRQDLEVAYFYVRVREMPYTPERNESMIMKLLQHLHTCAMKIYSTSTDAIFMAKVT